MVNSFTNIKRILSENKKDIQTRYYVKNIGIFGSYVRGEQKKSSDIDLLVEFEKPIGLFKFINLEEYLEKLLGAKVDLVTKKSLKPRIGKRILNEVITI